MCKKLWITKKEYDSHGFHDSCVILHVWWHFVMCIRDNGCQCTLCTASAHYEMVMWHAKTYPIYIVHCISLELSCMSIQNGQEVLKSNLKPMHINFVINSCMCKCISIRISFIIILNQVQNGQSENQILALLHKFHHQLQYCKFFLSSWRSYIKLPINKSKNNEKGYNYSCVNGVYL